ncbi:MAG: ABC transporter ATP-binding protein [Gammaproteobacteria bacterium]
MAPAVRFDQVRKDYHAVRALKGVDFSIERGEFFGLLGPNGAGKSTLINIMAGLVKATSGRISVLGYDVVRQYRQSRAALGVVPQELVYDPFFTVREMLRLQSGYFGHGRENDAWIDELLEVLDLSHKANANLHDLSGGMKRRVLIAQAMVHKPQVVVLDEPTAGVDVELRMALWDFTRRLHKAGHTIVLTTHYLEEAESLCDRIAILHHGEVQALDSKLALLARHPYRLLCLTLDSPGSVLPPAVDRLVIERDGAAVTLRLHKLDNQIGALLDAVKQAGIGIVDLRTRDMGLEDIFLELTRSAAA